LTSADNTRQASFYIVVDQKKVIKSMPLDEVAWHAEDIKERCKYGNNK
jgi:N-acetylmuramoyl-L-alanine amidase CwlA